MSEYLSETHQRELSFDTDGAEPNPRDTSRSADAADRADGADAARGAGRGESTVLMAVTALIVLAALAGAWSAWNRGEAARALREAAEQRYAAAAADAARCAALRELPLVVADQPADDTALSGLVTAVLAEAGLPSTALRQLTPEPAVLISAPVGAAQFSGGGSDAGGTSGAGGAGGTGGGGSGGGGGGGYRRQVAGVELQDLTLEELGRFLERWRMNHPRWVPLRIELQHTAASGGGGGDGQNRFTIRLALACTTRVGRSAAGSVDVMERGVVGGGPRWMGWEADGRVLGRLVDREPARREVSTELARMASGLLR